LGSQKEVVALKINKKKCGLKLFLSFCVSLSTCYASSSSVLPKFPCSFIEILFSSRGKGEGKPRKPLFPPSAGLVSFASAYYYSAMASTASVRTAP
jgi:hypothetical protein